jgi:hypothetical protein
MPGETTETGPNAGDFDVAALVAQLREELERTGPRQRPGSRPSSVRVNARAAADRLWPVSADRHIGGRSGAFGALYRPVKLLLRKLVRWYVEPVFADQRAYNDALLRLVDDLYEEVDRLHAELEAIRGRTKQ